MVKSQQIIVIRVLAVDEKSMTLMGSTANKQLTKFIVNKRYGQELLRSLQEGKVPVADVPSWAILD